MELISLSIASFHCLAYGELVACLYDIGVGKIRVGISVTVLQKVTADFPYLRPLPSTVSVPVLFWRPSEGG
jgi:hypothetical protein